MMRSSGWGGGRVTRGARLGRLRVGFLARERDHMVEAKSMLRSKLSPTRRRMKKRMLHNALPESRHVRAINSEKPSPVMICHGNQRAPART